MCHTQVFSYAGDLDRVLGVRALMRDARFEATPRIWGSLLVACGAARHLEQAHVLWDELKQRHKELAAAAEGACPGPEAAAAAGAGAGASGSGGLAGEEAGGLAEGSAVQTPPTDSSAGSSSSVDSSSSDGFSSSGSNPGEAAGTEYGEQRQAKEGAGRPLTGLLTTEVFNAMMTACIEGYQVRMPLGWAPFLLNQRPVVKGGSLRSPFRASR